MIHQALQSFLDDQKVCYVTLTHSPAFTAQQIAAIAHVPGKELAKTVIVKLDGTMAMAVLPAPAHVDFDLLRRASGAREVDLASEQEFADRFPDCEIGAMPPFGNLYGMDTYADESLTQDEFIAFNACSHTQLIRLPFADFERLVRPRLARLTSQVHA